MKPQLNGMKNIINNKNEVNFKMIALFIKTYLKFKNNTSKNPKIENFQFSPKMENIIKGPKMQISNCPQPLPYKSMWWELFKKPQSTLHHMLNVCSTIWKLTLYPPPPPNTYHVPHIVWKITNSSSFPTFHIMRLPPPKSISRIRFH